ncbi:cytochrome o ubiquinol oxidase subunit III [Altererythrobacter indicus]|uniref:Cytochrome bo(3) ubiquinol oxidase subunit 3 n=1 Tax=Altericroceibacterium indicum TaxID=374177 RepID=A0A845ACM1_9SPHN|nr:cytochrome c oxidase subunit 3 [Altericroceibacterium indicum]MXP27139.1 cytochrome o ubiquinol oxidase subunit III [Altericroceibacterium indicum]
MTTEKILHPGINIGQSDPEQHMEAEPIMFGFWVFLMSDLVLFALLLVTYSAMSLHGIAGGPWPQDITDLTSAGIETALLLLSSCTFAMASLAQKYSSRQSRLVIWLVVTALLGCAFVGMEIRDFAKLAAEGVVPQRSGFLSAHFTLLGCHALHVSAGIVWMIILLFQMRIKALEDLVRLRIMRLALFWHMLDIVWVAILTFVFLYGAV